jgi:hypothetical protein
MFGVFMQHLTTSIGVLFQAIAELEQHTFENDIEFFQSEHLEIETPNGFCKINGMIKKNSDIIKLVSSTQKQLKCANKHLLFTSENNYQTVDTLKTGDEIILQTGIETISDLEFCGNDDVFDIEVDNEKHWYYDANGFLHHNSLMTSAISHAYSKMGYNAITIVPSSDLVEQTVEWYRTCGMDTGVFSGDEKDFRHGNVVATWQAIQYNLQILEIFDCLIWDEVHGAAANVAQKIINESAFHMPFKFGVTGTFPKHIANRLSLHSAIGDILIEIPAKWLIENGYLAEVEIEKVCIKQKDKEEFPDYAAERAYLSRNEERMDLIADLIIDSCNKYGNTLVLVNSVPFGEKLATLIEGAVFLYGGSKKEDRKEQYDLFEDRNDMIVVATSGIASTGISIDRVFCLMFIDAGKSFIKTIQSVGRGTRLAHDKNKVHVIDIFADLKWSKKHSRERDKWYKEAEYPIVDKHNIKI